MNKSCKKTLSLSHIGRLESDLIENEEGHDFQPTSYNGNEANRHLTDQEFLLCLELSTQTGIPALLEHIDACFECSRELSRLRACMSALEDDSLLPRVQERVLSRLKSRAPSADFRKEKPSDGPRLRPVNKTWLSLAPFFQFQAASAAHDAEAERIEFPVTQAGDPVPGLLGALMRRSNEYYAKIEARDDQVLHNFRDRKVRLTISDPEEEAPIFERTMPIGVVVLIGTGLKKKHSLSAELA